MVVLVLPPNAFEGITGSNPLSIRGATHFEQAPSHEEDKLLPKN